MVLTVEEYHRRVHNLNGVAKSLYTLAVVEAIDDLLQQGEETGERQSAWELIQSKLLAASLAHKRRVLPEHCAIDDENRNKFGASGGSAQIHGAKIIRQGFSLLKAGDACSIQAPEDNTEIVAANRRMESLSQGLIPALIDALVVVLGANHTTLFLRQVKSGVRCIGSVAKELGDETGHLNRSRLEDGRPIFADALEQGLTYFNLHQDAFKVWPRMRKFIHRVLNVEARGIVGEVETMLGMCAHAQTMGDDVDWEAVERDAASTQPTCEAYLHTLRRYVETNAGGPDGTLLNELSEFQHLYEHCSQRILGGEYIEAVSKLQVSDCRLGETILFVKNAFMKANLNGPKVTDGMCRTLLPSALAKIGGPALRKDVLEAETLLTEARGHAAQLPREQKVRILGMLDQRVAMHLVGKGSVLGPSEVYDSIVAIAEVMSARYNAHSYVYITMISCVFRIMLQHDQFMFVRNTNPNYVYRVL